jgi:hypothetical protein
VLGCSQPANLPQAMASDARRDGTAKAGSGVSADVAPPAAAAPAPSTPSPPPSPSLCTVDGAKGPFAATVFVKLHSGPVLSAAVGTPPRAAIWSGRALTLFEREQARELPSPRLPPGARVELFFGRDNQPRLMGFAPGKPGDEIPVYLRFRQGTFRPEPSELGPLAAPRGALYGVLGFDDPEVVCRPRERCIVKRTAGWGRVAAHDAPARIVLRGGSAFALHARHVERLGDGGWSALEPARVFAQPFDVWLAPSGELWVTDASAGGLFRLIGPEWQSVASPVTEPRAVFGRSDRAVYVVGANGAAEYDGTRFHCVKDVPGPLHLVLAVGDEIWLAGERGVYRSVR